MKRNAGVCEVPCKDYDFYRINLPFSVITKKQINRFIYEELGKLHPCFGDDFAFDSRLKLNKSGVEADVVVMNKLKLAEYKKGFFVNESKKRFFIKQAVYSKAGIACVTAAVVLLALVLIFSEKKKTLEISSLEVSEPEVNVGMGREIKDLFTEFVLTVKNCGGKMTDFSWQLEQNQQIINGKIAGMYPEQFGKSGGIDYETLYEFSEVKMTENGPEFSVKVREKADSSVFLLSKEEITREFKEKLRDFFNSKGIVIKRETVLPFSVQFSTGKDETVFKEIKQFCREYECSPVKLKISSEKKENDRDQLLYEIQFVKSRGTDFSFVLDSEVNGLFIQDESDGRKKDSSGVKRPDDKGIAENMVKTAGKESGAAIEEDSEKNILKKIGSSVNENGIVTEYFKNEEGKIVSRRKNE